MGAFGERLLAELRRANVALDDGELARRLGVHRAQVNQECRLLAGRGVLVRGPGPNGLIVTAVNTSAMSAPAGKAAAATGAAACRDVPVVEAAITSGGAFEARVRSVLSHAWGVTLESRVVTLRGGATHSFDFVSPDGAIVGDAKWFKDLQPIPAAKLSVIAEYVWLLEHVERARRRFLIFGNDRAVPERWLRRFRPLLSGVEFWFLDDELTRLA